MCRAIAAGFPLIDGLVQLFDLYEAYEEAVEPGYAYNGTLRELYTDEVPAPIGFAVDVLTEQIRQLHLQLMLEPRPAPPGTPPICIGAGHNWALFCWRKHLPGLQGAHLLHFDSHPDFAYARDGYEFFLWSEELPPTTADWADMVSRGVDIDEWIQPAVIDGTLGEVEWVMPVWTQPHFERRVHDVRLCVASDGTIQSFSRTFDYDGVLFTDPEAFASAAAEKRCGPMVEVTFAAREQATLVGPLAGPLLLDIDLDHLGTFNLLGPDEALPDYCPTDEELEAALADLAEQIAAVPEPELVTIALSPGFTCNIWKKRLLDRVLALVERRWPPRGPASGKIRR